jgi:hypothetical protein
MRHKGPIKSYLFIYDENIFISELASRHGIGRLLVDVVDLTTQSPYTLSTWDSHVSRVASLLYLIKLRALEREDDEGSAWCEANEWQRIYKYVCTRKMSLYHEHLVTYCCTITIGVSQNNRSRELGETGSGTGKPTWHNWWGTLCDSGQHHRWAWEV